MCRKEKRLFATLMHSIFRHRDVDVHENEDDLNIQFLKKYFQVNTLEQTLQRRRNEFQSRSEQLQKRQEAFHQKEMMFKERIIR